MKDNEFAPNDQPGEEDASTLEPVEAESMLEPVEEDDPIYAAKVAELEELALERTGDLQRLQAEYVNYKRRVDRDRARARSAGVESVVLDLMPILDSVEAARVHDELTGGFRLVADELAKVLAKHGVVVYGEPGDPFDPTIHDALMHTPFDGEHDVTVVSTVMQRGVRLHDRVVRPARVGVADPE